MLILIPVNTPPSVGKDIINDNFSETELRLQAIEVNTYIRSDNGQPSNLEGNEDDYYIDSLNQDLYQKRNGNWVFITNMKGDTGRGFVPRGEWSGATIPYNVDDLVTYNGSVYRVVTGHTSGSPPTGNANYEIWSRGFIARGAWSTATLYRINDIVTHNGSAYRVSVEHTSSATTKPPHANFQIWARGYRNRGSWAANLTAEVDDIFIYNGSAYRVINNHTTSAVPPTSADYELWARGFNPRGSWATNISYNIGDIVLYQGTTYLVLANHLSSTAPSGSANYMTWAQKGDKGDKGDRGLTHRGAWSSVTVYVIDDAVTYQGSTWRAMAGNTNIAPAENSSWTLIAQKGDKGNAGDAAIPVGVMNMWLTDSPPANHLLCQGQILNQADFTALFNVIGNQFGGDAVAGTFALPDMRKRVPVGKASSSTGDHDLSLLGTKTGIEKHKLTAAEMPAHAHSNPRTGVTNPDLSHAHSFGYSLADNTTVGGASNRVSGIWSAGAGTNQQGTSSNNINGSHDHAMPNTNSSGGDATHENMQPSIVINYIIRF